MASTVTANTIAYVSAADAPATRGFFGRWLDALVAARMQEAERQVRRYRSLVEPSVIETAGLKNLDAAKAFERLPFAD